MKSSLPPPLPPHAQQGSVASTLRSLAAGTQPSEVWRTAAFALLRLNPKECEALALVFEEEAVSDDLRLLVLDLLAGAGSFEAQVVIRRLLALAVARRDGRVFATFVQRLGIVEAPDGPTLRFLMSVYAESRNEPHDIRAACAYALGAAAGQAFSSGDPDAAVRASDVLRRDLLSATTVVEKCALVTALGNAGVASDIMLVSRFTQDAEGAVRAAAALAMRKLNVPEARTHLVQLVGDREVKVAQSALAALGEHKLDDGELERLAEQVTGGHTQVGLDMQILRLVVKQRPRLTSVPGRAGAIESALRILLGRVEAAASGDGATITGTGSGERRVVFPSPIKFPSVTSASGSVPAMMRSDLTPIPPPPPPMHAHPPAPTPRVMKAMKMTAPQTAYVPQPPLTMPEERLEIEATTVSQAPTVVDQAPLAQTMRTAPEPATLSAIPAPPPPAPSPSGAYRLVNPGDSVETVRARMIEMGLDPNARMSIIPQPPPRRAPSEPRQQTHLGPEPILRRS